MKKLLILGIAALALTACTDVKVPFMSSAKTESSSSSSTSVFASLKEQLNGREFFIVTDGYNKKASIGFQGDRVYGFSGINRYFGNYQISGGKFVEWQIFYRHRINCRPCLRLSAFYRLWCVAYALCVEVKNA